MYPEYGFLLDYGSWLGEKVNSLVFSRSPFFLKWGRRLLPLSKQVCQCWIFSKVGLVIYLLFFLFLSFISLHTRLDLGRELFNKGTTAGGEFIRSHLFHFYPIWLVIGIYLVLSTLLFLSIIVLLAPDVLGEEGEKERQELYLIFENRIRRLDSLVFYSWICIVVLAYVDLYFAYILLMDEHRVFMKQLSELRLRQLEPLIEILGIKVNPGDSLADVVQKIQDQVQLVFFDYVMSQDWESVNPDVPPPPHEGDASPKGGPSSM